MKQASIERKGEATGMMTGTEFTLKGNYRSRYVENPYNFTDIEKQITDLIFTVKILENGQLLIKTEYTLKYPIHRYEYQIARYQKL